MDGSIASGIIAKARTGQCPPFAYLGGRERFLKGRRDGLEPVGDMIEQQRRYALGRIALGLVEQIGEEQCEVEQGPLAAEPARGAPCGGRMAREQRLQPAQLRLLAVATGHRIAAAVDLDRHFGHQSSSPSALSRAIRLSSAATASSMRVRSAR